MSVILALILLVAGMTFIVLGYSETPFIEEGADYIDGGLDPLPPVDVPSLPDSGESQDNATDSGIAPSGGGSDDPPLMKSVFSLFGVSFGMMEIIGLFLCVVGAFIFIVGGKL